jgi:GNAT superfamily N-acetyltransferase
MSTEMTDVKLVTRSGLQFDVRRSGVGDEMALAEFFTHVTPEDLRFRFLSGMKKVSHDRLVEMTRVDDGRSYNFLAFLPDGMLVAVAILASDEAGRHGEVAISIRADHKHQGISWALLSHISRYAEEQGFESIESIENRDNHEAIDLEREMGFTVMAYPDDPGLVLVRRQLGNRSTSAP